TLVLSAEREGTVRLHRTCLQPYKSCRGRLRTAALELPAAASEWLSAQGHARSRQAREPCGLQIRGWRHQRALRFLAPDQGLECPLLGPDGSELPSVRRAVRPTMVRHQWLRDFCRRVAAAIQASARRQARRGDASLLAHRSGPADAHAALLLHAGCAFYQSIAVEVLGVA